MEKKYSELKGKIVLVTGASSGIGATTATEFAKYGASLVLSGRNVENLQQVKNSCLNEGLKEDQVVVVAGDIVEETVRQELIGSAIKIFNKLDILVNNAGIAKFVPIKELTIGDFDEIYNVNLRASLALTLLALPHLVKTKGNIVNVSSIAAFRPTQNSLPYCVAKAALDNFTKGLAFEMAPQGIRVNSVNSGGVRTNINRSIPLEIVQAYDKKMDELHPIGRSGTTKEIANAIIFLSSDQASFITGQLLSVCGGAGLGGVKII